MNRSIRTRLQHWTWTQPLPWKSARHHTKCWFLLDHHKTPYYLKNMVKLVNQPIQKMVAGWTSRVKAADAKSLPHHGPAMAPQLHRSTTKKKATSRKHFFKIYFLCMGKTESNFSVLKNAPNKNMLVFGWYLRWFSGRLFFGFLRSWLRMRIPPFRTGVFDGGKATSKIRESVLNVKDSTYNRGHRITSPKNALLYGKSPKFTIDLECFIPPKQVI